MLRNTVFDKLLLQQAGSAHTDVTSDTVMDSPAVHEK